MMGGWNLPDNVTGREPQLTGEWPCRNCGVTLPEQPDCPQCGDELHVNGKGEWECGACGYTADGNVCPGGCPEPDYDDLADRQREAREDYLEGRDA